LEQYQYENQYTYSSFLSSSDLSFFDCFKICSNKPIISSLDRSLSSCLSDFSLLDDLFESSSSCSLTSDSSSSVSLSSVISSSDCSSCSSVGTLYRYLFGYRSS